MDYMELTESLYQRYVQQLEEAKRSKIEHWLRATRSNVEHLMTLVNEDSDVYRKCAALLKDEVA